MEDWKYNQRIDISYKSSWIEKLEWQPNLDTNKKGLIRYKTKANENWYKTTHEISWNKFQEIINLEKKVGERLHQENLIK